MASYTTPTVYLLNKMKQTMKTKSILLAAFFVMSLVVAAIGKDEPTKAGLAVVSTKGADVFKVIYKSETPSKVKLNLYNAESSIVYSETIESTEGFILPLNFKGLALGEYTLEVVDAAGKRTEKITYGVVTSRDNIRVAKIYASADNKFLVAIQNPASEQVTVRIFDAFNNLVHSEVKQVSGNFAQVYNVKNLKGSFTFEVSDASGNVKTVQF
jgi:hypothetical protein